jgi:hypothetical protein
MELVLYRDQFKYRFDHVFASATSNWDKIEAEHCRKEPAQQEYLRSSVMV